MDNQGLLVLAEGKFMPQDVSATSANKLKGPSNSTRRPSHWQGVFAMSLCAFALVASEFMPVSLLTPMATDLGISEGGVGQGIAISGLFAVLTSLTISALSGTMDRKYLLLGLTALMGVSGALVALAADYPMYMAGRALIGVVVGGFWSMSAATAMRLVDPTKLPRALAIFNGGSALATVLAAPVGSYLGAVIGWRGAFFCLVPVSILCMAWLWLSLPSLAVRDSTSKRRIFATFAALRNRTVAWGMLACGAFFMGQFILYTYVRPFLESVTRIHETSVSLVLLVLGVAGFVGTLFVGRFISASLYRTLAVIPALMAAIACGLIPLGPALAAVVILLGFWGLLSASAPVGWWNWIAKVMPHNAEVGGGLMVAVIQTSIALGSTVGGILFDAGGHVGAFAAAAAVLSVASALTFLTSRSARREVSADG